MKIALYHNLPSGGARRAMVEMTRRLVARGHTVDEICPETAERSFLPLEGSVRQTVVLPFSPWGVLRHRVPLLTPYITALRLVLDMNFLARLGKQAAQLIDEGGYDLAFTHDCQLVQNPDVLRFLRTPALHYCHHGARSRLPGPPEDFAVNSSITERLKQAYYALPVWGYPRLRERRAAQNIRAAERVLTNSCSAQSTLRAAYGIESQVCYLGVDTERFRPLGVTREAFVLSVGAVHYFKGYRFLITALGQLPAALRPPLLIAANSESPDERAILEALAEQHQVSLTIVRITDDDALVSLYNRAAAFVYTPIMEPWGLTAVEAMACGAPVVAVAEGGVRESVNDGETGLLTPRDTAAFAAALARVLADKSLAAQLGAAGVERVKQLFTWERTVDHLEQHLVGVVNAHER